MIEWARGIYRRIRMRMPCSIAGHEPGEIDESASYMIVPGRFFPYFSCARCGKPNLRLALKPTRWE